jgi:Uncharacterised nucleotidyltransferase
MPPLNRGKLIASALRGAWRAAPPSLELSPTELEEIAPLLLASGAAGLVWWKIRNSAMSQTHAALQLQQAHRTQTLRGAIHERNIKLIFAALRAAKIEAMLLKGWAIARSYPERGLRPYGDIDLAVRPEQTAEAEAALSELDLANNYRTYIDLTHEEIEKYTDRKWDELCARSRTIPLDSVDVRILSAEDHLRLICIHLLKHGGWRPLWLCDVALAIESRPDDFDWEYCLGRNRKNANWITSTIGLANHLLGARIDDLPVATEANRLPHWLARYVLKLWESPQPRNHIWMLRYKSPMASYLRRPSGAIEDLRSRWPNPIEATIRMNGTLNEWSRFHYQLSYCLLRSAHFLRDLPRMLSARE